MRNLTLLLLTLFLGACSKELPSNLLGLQEYVAEPDHGLVRSRTVEGIRTTVSLIPPELNALRELGPVTDSSHAELDALKAQYAGQYYFVVNLATDGVARTGDIMHTGVHNVDGFKQQAFDLNFAWDEMVRLRCGPATYKPVLSTLENTYGLTKDRNVVIVFTPPNKQDRDFFSSQFIELEITNDLFGTGVQLFKFRRSDLEKVQHAIART
jgi:hypothetical protein